MKVALVITIKNERRLLRQNVLYHLVIGFSKVYIYLDGTKDNSAETIKDLKGVEIETSIDANKYKDLKYLSKFCKLASEHHTARQCLNTYDALLKCKKNGIDWLVSLDADELFLSSLSDPTILQKFFKKYHNYDVIQLQPLEVISRQEFYGNVMAEETLFKTKKNFSRWLDKIYLKYYNPYTKSYYKHSYWLGHTMGKCAINAQKNIIPKNVHRYRRPDEKKIKVAKSGYLLHYHIYDFEDFLKKYHNFEHHPDTFLSGNSIEYLKKLWRNMVNDISFDEIWLQNYFRKYILFDKMRLKRLFNSRIPFLLKRKENAVIDITYPKDILTAHELAIDDKKD